MTKNTTNLQKWRPKSHKILSWSPLGASWELSWGLLGASWGVLGASWAHLGKNPTKIRKKSEILTSTWEPKSNQNRKKSMLKKDMFWDKFFLGFFWIFHGSGTLETIHFSTKFGYKMENLNFVKNVDFPEQNCYFSGFGPSKINKKSKKKLIQKWSQKMMRKNIEKNANLEPESLPKWGPKSKKTYQKNHWKICPTWMGWGGLARGGLEWKSPMPH